MNSSTKDSLNVVTIQPSLLCFNEFDKKLNACRTSIKIVAKSLSLKFSKTHQCFRVQVFGSVSKDLWKPELKNIGVTNPRNFSSTTFACNRLPNGFNKTRIQISQRRNEVPVTYTADVKRVVCTRQGLTTNLSGEGFSPSPTNLMSGLGEDRQPAYRSGKTSSAITQNDHKFTFEVNCFLYMTLRATWKLADW